MKELKGYKAAELEARLQQEGFAGYRARQIFNWLYSNLAADPKEMNNLPQRLKDWLQENLIYHSLDLEEEKRAGDGTINFLWKLKDGRTIESVLLPQRDSENYTACISSQVGCQLACKFCATGQQGWERDLTAGEMVDQVWQSALYLKSTGSPGEKAEKSKRDIRNLVFMGMGEPLLNYQAVRQAVEILGSETGFNIGSRRITISTAGIIPGIKKMSREMPQVGLALSLHAADNKLRSRLVPLNKKYNLQQLHRALQEYLANTGRRITVEYALIHEVNDREEQARQLVGWLKGLTVFVNLIPLNPVKGQKLTGSSASRIEKFKKIISQAGYPVQVRQSRGQEVKAACGQLKETGADGNE